MKQRLSSLDIKVIAHELSQSLVSLRLANIYDLSSRIFLLKFAKPDHREQLIIDSGFRCHLTSFSRSTAAAPSPFVARLRKFLRTRRCTAVRQIGTDRVIELQFAGHEGEAAYRLFLEFYAGGNVVLTDSELKTLALLRSVTEGDEHEQYRAGLPYRLDLRQNFDGIPDLTKERVKEGLVKAVERQEAEERKKAAAKRGKSKTADRLRKALAVTTHEFPPVLLDHALFVTGFDRELPPEKVLESEELLQKLMLALEEASKVVQELTSTEKVTGYIVAKQRKAANGDQSAEAQSHENPESQDSLLYDDFHPFKPAQLLSSNTDITFVEFEGFNKTADEFFSSLEGQRLETRLQEREDNAKRKIEAARQEQSKRIDGLQQVQELNIRKAQAIEANVERVEEAVAAVNGLIAQGMDWIDIGRLIENEQARHNAVAQAIKLPLKLHENTVTLLLTESSFEPDEDEMADETDSEVSDSEDEARPSKIKAKEVDRRLAIDVDLASSAWSNARQYYDQKRTAAVKQEKTAQASQKALKSTEQKVMTDLKKGLKQEKDVLRPVRKQMWFEKFTYFISSDGYLVLAGKDAQQNELLYRRHLRKGDAYIHADLHGAASVIVKNNPATPTAPIPPSTLGQAGQLAVCTSSAWDSKAVMSAWWVNADQVSKTAPTGEYLTTGGFMVRGKKNFLPPAQLLLGFAVMFLISEESKARHVKHRLQNIDRPVTPELTDGETVAESSVAGDGEDGSGSDDEFPDAATSHTNNDAIDEDDGFPDANHQQSAPDEDDDFEDVHADANGFSEDEGRSAANPLQLNGVRGNQEAINGNDDGEENHDDEDDDDEDDDADAEQDETLHENDDSGSKAIEDNNFSQAGDDSKDTAKASSQTSRATPAKQKAAPKVRGKKGKAKKAAQKYANQDEEDREMAMKLLGSRAAEEQREAAAAEKASKSESAEAMRARRRAQHEKTQRQGLEAEEIRRLNLEEGVEDLDEEGAAALTPLDALVGMPLPGDEILEAIPVCAPWSALAKYKYKAKMQPGQQKKGKAMREILGKWAKDASDNKKMDQSGQDTEKIWPREADLVKAWKEAEVIGVIPVKSVRVMISNGGEKNGGGKGGRGGKGGGRGGKGSKKK